jgi:hypothetical protein
VASRPNPRGASYKDVCDLGAKGMQGRQQTSLGDEAVTRLQWPLASAENICMLRGSRASSLFTLVGRYLAGWLSLFLEILRTATAVRGPDSGPI